MIRTDAEYRAVLERVQSEARRLAEYREKLTAEGMPADELERVLEPIRTFHTQLAEEVRTYDRLKRGQITDLVNLRDIGRFLIGARIARGISQRELAGRLNVNESQVSRDERNEYHGITVDRVTRILEALELQVTTSAQSPRRQNQYEVIQPETAPGSIEHSELAEPIAA